MITYNLNTSKLFPSKLKNKITKKIKKRQCLLKNLKCPIQGKRNQLSRWPKRKRNQWNPYDLRRNPIHVQKAYCWLSQGNSGERIQTPTRLVLSIWTSTFLPHRIEKLMLQIVLENPLQTKQEMLKIGGSTATKRKIKSKNILASWLHKQMPMRGFWD